MNLFYSYEIVSGTLPAILVIMFSVTLCRVLMIRKFTFVIKLITLLIICDLFWTVYAFSSAKQLQTEEELDFWIWTQAITYIISDTCFTVSHWMFAFEYYSISRYMPFLLAKCLPDASMVKCDEVTYYIVLVLNIIGPVANGVSLLLFNICQKNRSI